MKAQQIIKGSLPIIVLQLLNNNGQMYGYEILKAVETATKGNMLITEAALYPTLHRLETEGYISFREKIAEGRTRKYYKLNNKGKKRAENDLSHFTETYKQLQKVFRYKA